MRRAELPVSSGSRKLDSTVAGNSLFRILATTREKRSYCRSGGGGGFRSSSGVGGGSGNRPPRGSRRGPPPAGERPPRGSRRGPPPAGERPPSWQTAARRTSTVAVRREPAPGRLGRRGGEGGGGSSDGGGGPGSNRYRGQRAMSPAGRQASARGKKEPVIRCRSEIISRARWHSLRGHCGPTPLSSSGKEKGNRTPRSCRETREV